MSSIFSIFTSASTSTPSSHPQHRPSQSAATTTTNPTSPPRSSSNTSTNGTTTTQQQRTAEARAAFDASLAATGQSLNHELHARATNVHENATKLDKQDGDVRKETDVLKGDVDGLEREVGRARCVVGGVDGEGGEGEKGGKGMADEFEDEMRRIEAELDRLDGMLDEVEVEGFRGDDGGEEEEEAVGSGKESAMNKAVDGEAGRSSGRDQIAADQTQKEGPPTKDNDQHTHNDERRK